MTVAVTRQGVLTTETKIGPVTFYIRAGEAARRNHWMTIADYCLGLAALAMPDEMHPNDIGELTDQQNEWAGLRRWLENMEQPK